MLEKRTTVPLTARRWALGRTTAVALRWPRLGHDGHTDGKENARRCPSWLGSWP